MTDHPPPAEAVAAYAEQAALTAPEPITALPETLAMDLKERVEARAAGTLDAETWRTQEAAWTDRADHRYRATAHRAPLGADAPPVRVGVKDTVDVAGLPTRLGLRSYRHHACTSTPAIAALPRRHAAVTVKAVTTELNIGVGSGCLNPYAPRIDPGGSSTGAAVAVAANVCDIALGTDVLGSVRWPAGQCGTVGLRMTHDSALLRGVFPLSPPMDALGWVTRRVADLAYLWPLLGLDQLGEQLPPEHGPCRIGVVADAFGPDGTCGPVMRAAVDTARRLLEADGNPCTDVRIESLWRMRGPAWQLCARQAWDASKLWRTWLTDDLKDTTRAALEVGAKIDDDDYTRILQDLDSCRREVPVTFDATGADLWLLPLDPGPPPDAATAATRTSTIPDPQDADYEQRIAYTPIASFAGLPALTLPVARDERGAPLSVQLIGRPGAERRLIDVAGRLERTVGDLGFAAV